MCDIGLKLNFWYLMKWNDTRSKYLKKLETDKIIRSERNEAKGYFNTKDSFFQPTIQIKDIFNENLQKF
jgi:hypothetical protein